MAEIWKNIEGYKGYEVSNLGRIRSRFGRREDYRLLRQGVGDGRYPQVVLMRYGSPTTRRVHRLVAEAFLPNPKNKPQVDHKDGNTFNNNANNLRWATPSENTNNPITKAKMRGNKKEQRLRRMKNKMMQRLERMRESNRNIIGEGYEVFYDRMRDCYMLSIEPGRTIVLNGKTYIIDRVDDQPVHFHIRDYLNEDGSIAFSSIWKDIQAELNGGIEDDEDFIIATNEDGDEVIEWLED